MLWAKNATPTTLLLCICPAKTPPLHLAPDLLLQHQLSGGGALPIPVPGCHLLAERGLTEIGPWRRLGMVCFRPGGREFEKQNEKSPFTS